MKYCDLIQFEPVTEVIQLRWADEKARAKKLVSTYVISDRMADVILHRIIPSLQMDGDNTGRGLFIVGNYGTGKSHLMSLITAVAEYADLVEQVTHPAVVRGLRQIAGQFKVIRQETGATNMHLRDVVFQDLEKQLNQMGVEYHFPTMDEASSNKQLLVEMMVVFQAKFPDKGLIIALDELLDFLRARDDRRFVMDLNFLREVGEACELVPLRFITGIQEALFDNPHFQFAADSIRRVRARFDQASIVREDMAYVVSKRLLAKSDRQKQIIRTHLEKFTPLYSAMAEHLESYIELFPIHPAYLEVFDQVAIGERRDLLKALSTQMAAILADELPTDQPGLIAFDSYWKILTEDKAYKTIKEVCLVLDKTKILTDRISNAPSLKAYCDVALRIISGLAVQRLTVGDLYAPIGMPPAELRDRLCLYLPMPEQDADFLLATIETVLKEILRTVSGQFISHNPENDQYYLDLKKDIDFDALIDQRVATLDDNVLNRYYFDVLARTLELASSTYVPGFRIWDCQIPWPGHGITRQGYFFLGAPNERSTAHPARDFYIHFLALNGNHHNSIPPQPDEVYFSMPVREEAFTKLLQRFAGASEMRVISSGSNQDQYERKADQAFRQLSAWLVENLIRTFTISHKGASSSISEVIAKYRIPLRELSFRDQVYRLCGALLGDHFNQLFADYPQFKGIEFTAETGRMAAEAALRSIAGGPVTRPAQAVLDGLGLAQYENGRLTWTVEKSIYARHFIKLVESLPEEHVLNRSELVGGEPGAERDNKFKLEPEWVIVILVALVRQGVITLNLPALRIAEGELETVARMGLDALWRFTSISRPKPLPEQALREVFLGLDLDESLLDNPLSLDAAVSQLQKRVTVELNEVVRMIESLREGPRFWQEMVLLADAQQAARSDLEKYRQFLNGLQKLDTPARMHNLQLGVGEIRAAFKPRVIVTDLNGIFETLQVLQPALDYLYQAQALLPSEDPWQSEALAVRSNALESLRQPDQRSQPGFAGQLRGSLDNVITAYAALYLKLHQQARLDRTMDARKSSLAADPRWARMRALSRIDLLPTRQLDAVQERLAGVKTCANLQLTELRTHSSCPHCGYSPTSEPDRTRAADLLEKLEGDFDGVCKQWIQTLLTNLATPESLENFKLLGAKEREAVTAFIQAGALPEKITESFLDGLRDTLQGLELVTVDSTHLMLALTQPGTPCTSEELFKRFQSHLAELVKGKNLQRVRIQIDW